MREVRAPLHPPSANPVAPRESKLALRKDQLAQAALPVGGCKEGYRQRCCTQLLLHAPQNAESHPSLQPRFPKGRLILYAQSLCLLSHFAGEEGEGSMPRFQLFPSSHSGKAAIHERCKTSIVLKVSLHCQHVISFLHTCRTRTPHNHWMNHSSPQHLHSFLHHFQVTHWKQIANKSEREKKKKKQKTVFWVPSDTILTEEVFRTFYPLQIYHNFTTCPVSFVNTNCCKELNDFTVDLSSASVQEHTTLRSCF